MSGENALEEADCIRDSVDEIVRIRESVIHTVYDQAVMIAVAHVRRKILLCLSLMT